MKTYVECLSCFLQQAAKVARLSGLDESDVPRVVQGVAAEVATIDLTKSPPANAQKIYKTISMLTGCNDPYKVIKKEENEKALHILSDISRGLKQSTNRLYDSLLYSIAGNIIDYGVIQSKDMDEKFKNILLQNLVVNDFEKISSHISHLQQGDTVLYLADNCGEIVYDRLVVEYLYELGLRIIFVVKDGPIINDACMSDAQSAGISDYAQIITNGTRCPGTVLEECSQEFLDFFWQADLVISKGQGNFESLSETKRSIFFLLTIKCEVVARHMEKVAQLERGTIQGGGDPIIFFNGQYK